MQKKCPKCLVVKNSDEFHKDTKRKDGLQVQCKSCKHTYYRKNYVFDNKRKLQVKKAKQEFRDWYRQLKVGLSCKICGENHPACLDFHHLKDKRLNVAQLASRYGKQQLLAEIAKCEVLCSNCHRKLHYKS